MNWRDIGYIDVVSLLRGDRPPRVTLPVWARLSHRQRVAKPPQVLARVPRERWAGPLYLRRGAWRRDLIAVTRQLNAIVRSNAPMVGGLEAATLDAPTNGLESIFVALRHDISSGLSIAEAMRKRPRFFPRFYIDMVKVGEDTGRLDETLSQLIEGVLRTSSLCNSISIYTLYVGGVFLIQCVITFFLLIRVLPVFAGILADFNQRLPGPVLALNAIGSYLASWRWLPILIAVCVAIVLWRLLPLRRGLLSAALGRIFIWVPVLRTMFVKGNLARVAFALEKLLEARVPLTDALEDAASIEVNTLYRAALLRIKSKIQDGETLASAMEKEPSIPASFRSIVSIGESSGLLPEAFGRVARLYEREAAKVSKILLDVVAPIGVVALGCVTLFVALAWFATTVRLMDTLAMPG